MKIITNLTQAEKYLKQFPLSKLFDMHIQPYTSLITFEAEEKLIEEGATATCLYYLIEGRAKLYLTNDNGRVSLISFLNAPCFIGEIELLGAQPLANGVTAITPCTCYEIRLSECKDQLLNDVKFLRYICLYLGQKAIDNTNNYCKNQSYPLEVRLAGFILMSANSGWYRERHTEVSEFLGVTYRHLLYVLAGFVKKEILIKTEQGYFIKDRYRLCSLANVSPH